MTNIDNTFVDQYGIKHSACIIAERKAANGFQCLQWSGMSSEALLSSKTLPKAEKGEE